MTKFLKQSILLTLTGTLVTCVAIFADNIYFNRSSLQPICANKNKNGLWLRYYWYAGKHQSEQDWKAMLDRLRSFQIEYAYFHVLTTKSDGTLKLHKLENARKITTRVHQDAPQTRAIAWVYVAAAPQPDGLDLRQPAVRKSLINEALWLVKDCGFDGVQWDYEFCANDNRGLLDLLAETRAALPKEKLLSVATPMYYPLTLWGWNDDYFKAVSLKSDQLCVMCYDSYSYWSRAYAWLLSQEVIHISEDVSSANSDCKLLFGLPTYEDKTLSHNHTVESFSNSLRGLKAGLKDHRTKSDCVDGIALFADYTTDEKEWQTYKNFWLDCH